MSYYTELVVGGVVNRNNIIEIPHKKSNLDLDYKEKGNTNARDCYSSIYLHTIELKQYVEKYGSVSKYKGVVYSDYLMWDFDGPIDVTKAQNDAIQLYYILSNQYNPKNIRLFFSGNKGFHVLYRAPELEYVNPEQTEHVCKAVCSKIASGLKTFDGSIYDKTKIFRITNSLHTKTNLYKVPLTYEELRLPIEEIRDLAKTQRSVDYNPDVTSLNTDLLTLIKSIGEKEKKDAPEYRTNSIIEGIAHGFENGKRNSGLTSVAGLLHHRGFDGSFIRAVIGASNKLSPEPLSKNELDSIVSSVSKYSVDPEFQTVDAKKIKTFKDAGESWKKVMDESGSFSFGPRYPHLNTVMENTLLGDLVGIVAASGVGKSTLLMDLMNEYCKEKESYGLMLSLEMSDHACFFRGAQIVYDANVDGNVNSSELAYRLLHEEDLFKDIISSWERICVVDDAMSVNQIEDWIGVAKEKNPHINMVGIDYLQYIRNMSDITESMKIARELKSIVKRTKVIGINAIQTNKSILNSTTEVNDSHIEGAQAIKQAHDYMMYYWHSSQQSTRIHGKFGKTRWSFTNEPFDLVRRGLMYHSEDYIQDETEGGL